MSRILIVGSGITGSAVKYFLSNSMLGASGSTISIWEASHTAGGRMQTDRLFGDHRCDLGAQYISQNVGGLLKGLDVYDHLINHKSLDLIKDNKVVNGMWTEHMLGQHYIAATGTTNMTASLADGASIAFGKNVVGLEVESGTDKLHVLSSDASPEVFDIVVLTVPAPQSMKILQHKQPDGTNLVSSAILEGLQQVRYSSRFALSVYFEFPSAHAKQSVLDSVPWRAKYVFDDDVIRYVSIENFKYKQLSQVCTSTSDGSSSDANKDASKVCACDVRHILSILVHTSVPYGLAHPEVLSYCSPQAFKDMRQDGEADLEQRKQEVISIILERLVKPTALPALSGYAPLRTRLVGWEQSQVSRGYYAGAGTGTSGSGSGSGSGSADNSRGVINSAGEVIAPPAAVVLSTAAVHAETNVKLHVVSDGTEETTNAGRKGSTAPLLVLAGDAFTESNFDGCIKSARYAAQAIVKHFEPKKC